MDPFSITVGAISLASATKKAIGGIKRLKALPNAPQELQDLLEELSRFELILQAIEDTAPSSESVDSPLETLLGDAKDKMVKWEQLVEYRLTQAGTSSKVDRLRWVESSKDIDRLRRQLRRITANLDTIIGVRTSTTAQEILEQIRQLRLENQRNRAMASALDRLPQVLEEGQSGVAATRILSNFPHYTIQASDPGIQSVLDYTHNHTAHMDTFNAYARSRGSLQLQSTYQAARCRSDCNCECHHTSFAWSNVYLAKVFGSAHLESRGPSWTRASCHIRTCKVSTISEIRVIYSIPTWFAMKAIFIRYTSSPMHTPKLLIKIPRLIKQKRSRAIKSIKAGDLPSFKLAIASGECTPDDIDENGDHLLYHILWNVQVDMLLHLVDMGFDILPPVNVAHYWLEFLWNTLSGLTSPHGVPRLSEASPLQDLIPHFPWDEYKEEKGYTILHEIVCGLSGRDLDSSIQTHFADINRLDYLSRSPLQHAVRIQKIAAIRTLLKRGADPNVTHGELIREALRYSNAKSPEIIELLLHSGTAVVHSAMDTWIDESHYHSRGPWGLAIDKLLIEHGFDVNRQYQRETYQGRALLMALCRLGGDDTIRLKSIKQLITYGPNLEMKDSLGNTALHMAIRNQDIEAMKLLIQAGAQLDVRSDEEETIAHLAVSFSTSSGFVAALSDIGLARLDLDQRNEDGHTAYDLLTKRNGLRWEKYYKELKNKRRPPRHISHPYWTLFSDYGFWTYRARTDEYQVILALEALLHQIQDSQGVPKDQQYPPLGPYLSDDKDKEPIPGAWPV